MATWVPTGTRSTDSIQATTESAPSGDEGFDIDSVGSFNIGVIANSGVFSKAVVGAFKAYIKISGAWYRAPDLDFDIPESVVGLSRFAVTGWTVVNPFGKIAHVANGVKLSAGDLTLKYEAKHMMGHKI